MQIQMCQFSRRLNANFTPSVAAAFTNGALSFSLAEKCGRRGRDQRRCTAEAS